MKTFLSIVFAVSFSCFLFFGSGVDYSGNCLAYSTIALVISAVSGVLLGGEFNE